MHQAMHLAQQQCTDPMAARFGPHGTAAAKERGMIGRIWCAGPAEANADRPDDLCSFQR
jgi:hypothetical protein